MMGKKHKILLWGMMSTVMISVFGVVVDGDASALTYSSSHDIQFTFNSVISINLSSPNLVISDLAPGEYSDSNIITVGANTNASMGYQLSATVGQKNGTDALVNTVSSSNTFANLTSTKATLANFSDNTWGYSYCADTSTNCGASGSATWVSGSKGSTTAGYAGLPLDNNTNTAERGKSGVLLLSTTGPEDTIQSVQFKIGAKASSSQASGDYTNTINFYAVANPEPQLGPVSCDVGRICYNENALSGVKGTMGKQRVQSSNAEIALLGSNYSRRGYGFAGWNTSYDYSGVNYGPQETIVPSGAFIDGYPLYAIWIPSAGSMQNWSGCSSLPQGSVTALTDQRDDETYAIAKLTDGNCWMIENLRLDNTNSDNSAGDFARGYGGQFSGLADSETPWAEYDTAANSLYSTDGLNGTIAIGVNNASYRIPRYNGVNTPSNSLDRPQWPTSSSSVNDTSNAGLYGYGNYYSWSAAIADTTDYSSRNQSITVNSICPSGWRLPIGGDKQNVDTSEYWILIVNKLNGGIKPTNFDSSYRPVYQDGNHSEATPVIRALRSYPNNFVNSGYLVGGSIGYRGTSGLYWSSTVSTVQHANNLSFSESSGVIFPGSGEGMKYYGISVRCITNS